MQTVAIESRPANRPRIPSTAGNKKRPLESQVADHLLELLGTDDAFRRLFQENPTIALAKIGHPRPSELSLFCLPIAQLASKEHFVAAREEIKTKIVSAGALTNPHCYEAGQGSPALFRK